MSADLNAIKARWGGDSAITAHDDMAYYAPEDIAALLAEVERLRAAINEYDPATALHEILDIDPTDPVNARAHRQTHERLMGEWHNRVVGRDKVINEVKVALTQGITTDKAARGAAVRLIDNWLNRDLDAIDAEEPQ